MAKRTGAKKIKSVGDYRHEEATRPNNPPAGLAQYDSERPPRRRFEYDPHQDPQLVWAGKAEHLSFEVEAPSIHVHERLSTEAILRAVRKEPPQLALFGDEELDRSMAIEFYQHEQEWVNRLILGDSLVVMASLLEKERLGGKIQVVYIDPPYGINYNSNFQARISDKRPKESKDESVTREPEQVRAFRDTWELGVHSYLSYLRDRLLLARELVAESGSVFVQIGVDRLHLVRSLLDEVFGASNACPLITVRKTSGYASRLLPEVSDFLLWYAKDKSRVKFHQLHEPRLPTVVEDDSYEFVMEADGTTRKLGDDERSDTSLLPPEARIYKLDNITSDGFSQHKTVDFEFAGRVFNPGPTKHWKLRVEGMDGLTRANRLEIRGKGLWYRRYLDDFGATALSNIWTDTSASFAKRRYVVQTVPKIIERAVLMTTDPGDLVLDPTAGSGTSAWVSEKHGRRWILVDTSRVAVAIARERMLTAKFDYYRLMDDTRGIDGGLSYRSLTRVTASSIGYAVQPETEVLFDQPLVDASKMRVSGPFTMEALSRYAVNPMQEDVPPEPADAQATEGQDHVSMLLGALRKQGIPRRGSKPIPIGTLDSIANSGWVQAEGTYIDADGMARTFAVSLGPRFAPITVAQIDDTLHEAYGWDLVVFVGFAANAEAQQLVAKGQLGKFNVALLEANPDLLVGDLLKTTSSQTFRLFSAPEAHVKPDESGDLRVEVVGVDSFDASTGEVVSRSQGDIAAWFLDQDYDGIVFHVNQAFFPRSGGWENLQRTLKGTIDPNLMEALESFESLPFKPGEHKRAAVRVVDDFGTTSEAILPLD